MSTPAILDTPAILNIPAILDTPGPCVDPLARLRTVPRKGGGDENVELI